MTMATTDRKVAIVTGASQGIRAWLVEAYRRRNYAVVANSRTITTSDDPGVLAIAGDIADPAIAEQLVTGAVERFGRVDTLINNAGSSSPSHSPSTRWPTTLSSPQ